MWQLCASYESYENRVSTEWSTSDDSQQSDHESKRGDHESIVNVLWQRAGGSLASVPLDGISAVRSMRARANEIKGHALDDPQHRWRLLLEAARLMQEAIRMLDSILVHY